MIRHLSLDLWNTLIGPQPAYRRERASTLAHTLGISPELAELRYTWAKNVVRARTPKRLVGICATLLGTESGAADLARRLESLFLENVRGPAPLVVSRLSKLNDNGITLSVATNVGVMESHVLGPWILTWQPKIAFYTADDEVGYSKPDRRFFEHMMEQARLLDPGIKANEMLHIGDDPHCDYHGALRAQLRALLVSGVHETPHALDIVGRL